MFEIIPLFLCGHENIQYFCTRIIIIDTIMCTFNKTTTLPCSYSEEEMYSIVKNRLKKLENGAAELMDGDDCLSEIRTRYGIEA